MKEYKCIAADPPWMERGGGKIKRGADRHYPLMKADDIVVTMQQALDVPLLQPPLLDAGEPVGKIADNAHMWLWVTDNYLKDGLFVMSELGFRYIRTLCWVKMNDDNDLQIGLGQYLRGSHELCLFGARGKAMVPKPINRMPSVIVASRARHSAKPQAAYDTMASVSPGPRLEMFARNQRPYWDAWGNEIDNEAMAIAGGGE